MRNLQGGATGGFNIPASGSRGLRAGRSACAPDGGKRSTFICIWQHRRPCRSVYAAALVGQVSGGPIAMGTKLLADDAAAGDFLGAAVATSGDTLVVGAYLDDDAGESSGAASVYRWDGAGWRQEAKLTASDATPHDLFGHAVAIDGDTVVVGAFFSDALGSSSGAAYVFRRRGVTWVQEAKLLPWMGGRGDLFGFSVSVSGNSIAVGAPALGGIALEALGRAYVYEWNGTGWAEEGQFTTTEVGNGFGYSVSVDAGTLLVGLFLDDKKAIGTREVYVYRDTGAIWDLEAKLTASDATKDDFFGASVAITGDVAVVGAFRAGPADTGAAYVYRRSGTS